MKQVPTASLTVDVRLGVYERLYLYLDEGEHEYVDDSCIVEDALDEFLPKATELP
ncbi:MAG: hypothetical protein U5J64_00955 [Halobacteriales archaeon]|nr:hypothetical protein [Halobacteriales archaeon]